MDLKHLGWTPHFENSFQQLENNDLIPVRVILVHRNYAVVCGEGGELTAEISGRMRYLSFSRAHYPSVGDWVAMEILPGENRGIIHAILPRQSCFSRKAVLSGGMPEAGGETDEQILAANIDTVFLVCGLDDNFNVRRIERYIIAAWDSGATPVVILNKLDLCDDIDTCLGAVEEVASGVNIHPVSAATGEGLVELEQYAHSGKTIAFLGSSGVGKSSLINCLAGEERLKVNTVRRGDSKGRHTTTHRELIVLPSGGMLIDTPGMRELALWADETVLERTFDDIEGLASVCRFRDCSHQSEPGCAIQEAITNGELNPNRLESYFKMQKELRHLAHRQDKKLARQEQREWDKKIRNHLRIQKEMRKKGLK